MKYLKTILYWGGILSIHANFTYDFDQFKIDEISNNSKKQVTSLPFNLQLSLDVIGIELRHYKDQFSDDWNTNIHAQVIIEEAELLVQTTPIQFQELLKTKIIELFQENDLFINFTQGNTITVDIDPNKEKRFRIQTKIKHIKAPKKHKHTKEVIIKGFKPKKIHGARRTMKRLQKEEEERRKKAYQELVERLASKKEAYKREILEKEEPLRQQYVKETKKTMDDEAKKLLENAHSEHEF